MNQFTFTDRKEYLRDLADEILAGVCRGEIHAADLEGTAAARVRWWLEHKRTAPDWFDDRDFLTLVELVESNIRRT